METQMRNPGCQSRNHTVCYGELWQCQRCEKMVCYAEGTDNDPDVCDDCWVAIHYPQYAEEQSRTTTLNAPEMQRVITQLLEQHGIESTDPQAFLWLALPEREERLIIERINEHYLSVALARPDGSGYFTLAPEVYFGTDATGWKPLLFGHAKTPANLIRFAEAWAGKIEAERWLTQAVALPEPAWQVDQDPPWCNTFDDRNDVCFAPNKKQETCPKMQQYIERLASQHQTDLSVAGMQLWLALPGTRERLLIAGLSGQRISITHCIADADDQLVCDTDLVFLVAEGGWQPIELLHTGAVWAAYMQRMAATDGVQVFDEVGEIRLPHFAEYWANILEQQCWLDKSQRLCV